MSKLVPTCPPDKQPCLNFQPTPPCWRTYCIILSFWLDNNFMLFLKLGNDSCVNGQTWKAEKHYASDVYGISGVSSIQNEIMENGPVEACFTVYQDFLAYKSGVYIHESGSALGGHCVKLIGWGVEGGIPYWLVNNSWTTYWGDNGRFKIKRGDDQCGSKNLFILDFIINCLTVLK